MADWRILGRNTWGSEPRHRPTRQMRLPATELWLHHTVTTVSKNPLADMRTVERIGAARFGHISYSYCVHPDGTVLEGAGLQRGAHTGGRNSTSFGVAWIGNYEERHPKVQQINSTRRLIAWLIAQGHLLPGRYPTGGHRDLKATACPGEKLYAILDDLRVPWVEEEAVPPMYDPPLGPIAAVWQDEGGKVIAAASPDGDVYCWGCEWAGNVRGKPYWGDRKVARIGPPRTPGGEYVITATTEETYELPDGMD